MDIKQDAQRFYVEKQGEIQAELTFIDDGSTITVDHTEVSEKLRGQKVGSALVQKVVEYARSTNKKVMPACSFAASEFEKHEEYGDVKA